MKPWLALGALVLLALIVSFAAQQPGSDSPTPSTTNRGPRGLAVLFTWLRESGAQVSAHDAALNELPKETRTLVLAAPAGSELTQPDVDAVRAFVEAGGTLVYLVPRAAPQPLLNHWLGVHPGPLAPMNDEPGVIDVGGVTVKVLREGGAVTGVRALRLSAERMLSVTDPAALEVAEHGAMWWQPRGRGDVWLAAGADLAENARLELADNARFWSQLPQPLVFGEQHHHATVLVPANLLATALQLLFLAALFVWARGVRLGAPRAPLPPAGGATIDYVRAMASLMRNAGVEKELVESLKHQLRKTLHERFGVPASWPWKEAAAETARRLSLPEQEVFTLLDETDFVTLSRRIATIERASTALR